MGEKFRWVPALKRIAEALAALIASGRRAFDRSELPDIAAARSAIENAERGKATANQTALAAILLAWLEPLVTFTVSSGFRKLSIAGWADPGERLTGLELGRRMIAYYLDVGPHGERETYGYAPIYILTWILAAVHPDPEIREGGRRLLVGELAVFRLMGGREVGCRVTPEYDKPEGNVSDILGLLGVPGFNARKRGDGEAYATSRIATQLWMQLERIVPRLTTVEDAVRALGDSGIRCARTWCWEGSRHGSEFHAGLDNLGACEGKGGIVGVVCETGPLSELDAFDWHPGSRGHAWGLELGPEGLQVFASPAGFALSAPPTKPGKPAPPPRPEPDAPDDARRELEALRAGIATEIDHLMLPSTTRGKGARRIADDTAKRLRDLL